MVKYKFSDCLSYIQINHSSSIVEAYIYIMITRVKPHIYPNTVVKRQLYGFYLYVKQ